MPERHLVDMDAAVSAVLGDARRRERQRAMTPSQRRQASRDAARERVTLELDPALVTMVRDIAAHEGISPAGVVNRFLSAAIQGYVDDQIDFQACVRPSRSPRYEWVVELELENLVRDMARKIKKS